MLLKDEFAFTPVWDCIIIYAVITIMFAVYTGKELDIDVLLYDSNLFSHTPIVHEFPSYSIHYYSFLAI